MGRTNEHEKNSELIDKLEQGALLKIDSSKEIPEHHKQKTKEFIIANAFSVRRYLKEIEERGYSLGENFEADEDLFTKDDDYSFYINRITIHKTRIQEIPGTLKSDGYRGVVQMHS